MESCTLREVDFSHPLACIPEPANNFIDSATHLHIRSGHIAQMPVGVAGNQALVFRFTHTAEAPSNAIVELLGPAACHGIWFNYGEYNGKAVPFILVLTYTDDTRQLVPFTTPATPPAGSLESFGVKTGKEIKGASMLLTGESSLIIDNLKY
jgi:hypothetical protein